MSFLKRDWGLDFTMDRLWGSSVKKQENEALDRTICLCPDARMSMTDTIRDKLAAALAPLELDIVDDSAAHEGHSGHRHGGERQACNRREQAAQHVWLLQATPGYLVH